MTDHRERNMATTRRWFTDGWLGDLTLADETFSDTFATNGIVVGRAGPIRNIENRLAGFPDLTTEIEALLAVDDTVVIRVRWTATHTGTYSGVAPTGKHVDVRVISMWRFLDRKAEENWTIQDQFGLLQQVGIISNDIGGAQVPAPRPPATTEKERSWT